MNLYVIWIDREHAKMFQFSNEKMERKVLHARHQDHHTHQFDRLDHRQQERAFFEKVVSNIDPVGKILILGPGVAKHHFQNFLSEHQPLVARKIVGCETVDHPTDSQIVAQARKFFNMAARASSG